jgi:hypothetical protein
MRMAPRAIRAGIIISLALPAFIVLMTSSLQAQFPKQPRPPFQPPIGGPKFERVWTCGKCGKEIGRGSFPPGTCPFCGVKIINGIGGGSNPIKPMPGPNPGPGPMPPFPGPNPGPGPMPGPMPPITQPAPNGGFKDLAGSTWQGSETLAGYGALSFTFNAGGQASMIDKDGNTPGNWNRVGNSVTLNFGGVVYTGNINGGQISGSARDAKNSWSWNVSNNQFNNAAPPINPQPMPQPVFTPMPMPQPVNPQPVNPQPFNPQPINPQPVISPGPQPNVQPPPTVQPQPPTTQPKANTQPPPAANPQAAETPRARTGTITIIIGIAFLCVGLAVVGSGVFFIVKSMK